MTDPWYLIFQMLLFNVNCQNLVPGKSKKLPTLAFGSLRPRCKSIGFTRLPLLAKSSPCPTTLKRNKTWLDDQLVLGSERCHSWPRGQTCGIAALSNLTIAVNICVDYQIGDKLSPTLVNGEAVTLDGNFSRLVLNKTTFDRTMGEFSPARTSCFQRTRRVLFRICRKCCCSTPPFNQMLWHTPRRYNSIPAPRLNFLLHDTLIRKV